MKKTVALCMIVKNEQDVLRRCLDSVQNKVDQIVIVDTGSTDETVSIAKEYTKDLFHMEWVNDFSVARNTSLKYAVTDYILVLDADEYLEESVDLLSELESEADYYYTKIYNLKTGDRKTVHRSIRLFRNSVGLHYKNRLHEHLNTMEKTELIAGGQTDFNIMHTGYTEEMLTERKKAKRNFLLMKAEVEENASAYNLFNMGKTYLSMDEPQKAIQYFKEAYSMGKEMSFAPELINYLCQSLGELKKYEEALVILNEAVEIYPREVDLFHIQAVFYMEIYYYKDAIRCMKNCLEIGDQGIAYSEGSGSYIAHFRLAEWYTSRNELTKGYEHILQAVHQKSDFVAFIIKYFEIVNKAGIPLDDIYIEANRIFPITNKKQFESVLEALYYLRHPLLQRYLDAHQVTVQDNVRAVAYQFNKEYKMAGEIWANVSEYDDSNSLDILLLSYILKDESLFKMGSSRMNLSQKELRSLKNITLNHPKDKLYLTKDIEEILLSLLVNLICLHEFEKFEELYKVLLQGSMATNIKICENLIEYGFSELAIDLLVKLFELQPRNVEVVELLGDLCMRSQYYEDAEMFYAKLLELSDEYSSYERLYQLSVVVSEKEEEERLKQIISKKFPLCLWMRNEKLEPISSYAYDVSKMKQESSSMRRSKKKDLIDLLFTVDEGLDFVKLAEKEQAEEMLDNCNYCLNIVSDHFTNDQRIQESLQKLMMEVLFIKPRLHQVELVDQKISEMKLATSQISQSINEIIEANLEIVFMPYKASMWDSFDSIYREAVNDPECEVYVVPIPYYEKNAEGQLVKFCYEGNDLPTDIVTTPFEVYDFEERKPDAIYVHNPFDGYNTLTMVDRRFFSENLSKYTDMLVYVPYYVAGSSDKPQVSLPAACNYVNKIVVQSAVLKQAYVNSGVDEKKLLDLGSPKIDAALRQNDSIDPYLNLWKDIQRERKTFLFNTGIADLLSTETWYSQIEETINYFLENAQFSLIWRPHPLTEITLKTMRPNIKQSYAEIKQKIDNSKNIVVDSSSNAYPAIHLTDAIISDYSSIMLQYIATSKPVLGLLNREVLGADRYYFADYLGCYLTGEGDTISQFVEMVNSNQDFKKEERIDRFNRSITNSDGTSGVKIHSSIKLDLLSGDFISLEKEKNNVFCES
ncbi:glycosyltransferase [Paenibacillus tundrae]|uniref:glycosyltransferase n=1 Tax=Paenibacillus tundrae TaxID=528187 RepID=UPI0022A921FE|nr:glycosyltransferase [Paenibacillus tundrae]MCZ1264088.1 glycosyltransferase [Paenibacillus tundrae]